TARSTSEHLGYGEAVSACSPETNRKARFWELNPRAPAPEPGLLRPAEVLHLRRKPAGPAVRRRSPEAAASGRRRARLRRGVEAGRARIQPPPALLCPRG